MFHLQRIRKQQEDSQKVSLVPLVPAILNQFSDHSSRGAGLHLSFPFQFVPYAPTLPAVQRLGHLSLGLSMPGLPWTVVLTWGLCKWGELSVYVCVTCELHSVFQTSSHIQCSVQTQWNLKCWFSELKWFKISRVLPSQGGRWNAQRFQRQANLSSSWLCHWPHAGPGRPGHSSVRCSYSCLLCRELEGEQRKYVQNI